MSEFVHPIRVRFNECDPQGIVSNAHYVTYIDIAMTELWRGRFGTYAEFFERFGVDTVVGSVTIDYRSPARPDDVIDVGITLQELGTTSIVYRVHMRRDDTTIATGSIVYVCIDPSTITKQPIPDDLRTALQQV